MKVSVIFGLVLSAALALSVTAPVFDAAAQSDPKSKSSKNGDGAKKPDAQKAEQKKTAGKGKKRRITRVAVDEVRTEPLRQTIPVIGRFVARQSGVVAARIGGAIGEFKVDVGDRVEKDDIIAVLVKDTLVWRRNLQRAEVAQFSAQLKTKNQEVKLLRQEMKRLDSLRKSPAFSQARLDDKRQEVVVAESEAAEAKAEMQMANANLKLTEINLYNADIRAPYSGVISKRHADLGAYVNIGAALVTMLDDKNMEIEADVPSERVGGINEGMEISALIGGKRRIVAFVRAVIPEENPQTRTRAVRFLPALKENTSSIAANQSVTLKIPAGRERQVVTVHKDAVLNRKGKRVVVLADQGKAQFRPVELGEATGTRFIVLNGLKPGDNVVVRGNERLLPGTPITFPGMTPMAGTDSGKAKPK